MEHRKVLEALLAVSLGQRSEAYFNTLQAAFDELQTEVLEVAPEPAPAPAQQAAELEKAADQPASEEASKK